jgi:membrane-bound lytic murein transglycosylase D
MRQHWSFWVLTALLLATLAAAAQAPASAHDPFAYWNASLNDAAETVLTGTEDSAVSPASETATSHDPRPEVLRDFAHVYWNGREDTLQQALERVRELRPIIEPILREQQVPPALIAAVLVESAGRSTAVSPRGARGVWQLMPDTARRYGLNVGANIDERLDVVKSTRAAAHYLYDLHAQFGSWRLALAAYNAGEGAVQHARDRAGAGDFLRLSSLLPTETRNYVPAVWSAVQILGDGASPLQ